MARALFVTSAARFAESWALAVASSKVSAADSSVSPKMWKALELVGTLRPDCLDAIFFWDGGEYKNRQFRQAKCVEIPGWKRQEARK